MNDTKLFAFGLGYSAGALFRRLGAAWHRAATCREAAKREALAARGIEAWIFDNGQPLSDPDTALAGTTHLLSSIPAEDAGDPVLAQHAGDIARLASLRWVGYLSTTGVYGDRGGGWVDETSALQPTGERGRRRVAAEAAWLDLWRQHGVPVHVFRLAGIYGPG